MSKESLVIPLQEVINADTVQVGGMARQLSALIRAGYPVPAGGCITSEAYTWHVQENGLAGFIEHATGELTTCTAEQTRGILAGVREAIIHAPMPPGAEQQIRVFYRRLAARAVAVRSSATAEDLPEHSFAGQYDTILHVISEVQCLEAVKQCWASLWNERAVSCWRIHPGVMLLFKTDVIYWSRR